MDWASWVWANRRNALSLLLRYPPEYWQHPQRQGTYRYLVEEVVAEATAFLRSLNDPAWPWDRQEVDGRVFRFRPDGSFYEEGEHGETACGGQG